MALLQELLCELVVDEGGVGHDYWLQLNTTQRQTLLQAALVTGNCSTTLAGKAEPYDDVGAIIFVLGVFGGFGFCIAVLFILMNVRLYAQVGGRRSANNSKSAYVNRLSAMEQGSDQQRTPFRLWMVTEPTAEVDNYDDMLMLGGS